MQCFWKLSLTSPFPTELNNTGEIYDILEASFQVMLPDLCLRSSNSKDISWSCKWHMPRNTLEENQRRLIAPETPVPATHWPHISGPSIISWNSDLISWCHTTTDNNLNVWTTMYNLPDYMFLERWFGIVNYMLSYFPNRNGNRQQNKRTTDKGALVPFLEAIVDRVSYQNRDNNNNN